MYCMYRCRILIWSHYWCRIKSKLVVNLRFKKASKVCHFHFNISGLICPNKTFINLYKKCPWIIIQTIIYISCYCGIILLLMRNWSNYHTVKGTAAAGSRLNPVRRTLSTRVLHGSQKGSTWNHQGFFKEFSYGDRTILGYSSTFFFANYLLYGIIMLVTRSLLARLVPIQYRSGTRR